jgi:hypothetical protein
MAFNICVSKCGTVAKGIAVRDQDVGIVEFESPFGYY